MGKMATRMRMADHDPIQTGLSFFSFAWYDDGVDPPGVTNRGASTMAAAAALEHGPIAARPSEREPLAALHDLLERRSARPKGQPACARLVGPDGTSLEVPESVYEVLVQVVHQMAQGHAVAIVPVHAQLTTQQAADMLGVSRPHLVKLVEDGLIPYTRPGKHRRIRLDDLMSYKRRQADERRAALDELAAESARLGLRF